MADDKLTTTTETVESNTRNGRESYIHIHINGGYMHGGRTVRIELPCMGGFIDLVEESDGYGWRPVAEV